MSWSYSGDPADSDKDQVRFRVGDTDTTDQLVSDEEILWAISAEPSTIYASALILENLAARFARQANKWVGDLRLELSDRAKAYERQAKQLRQQASITSGGIPFAGGISISDKDSYRDDTDRVRPSFHRDMFINPGGDTSSDERLDNATI